MLATTSSGNDAKHPWRLAGRKEKVKKKKERKKEKKKQNAPSENQPMQLATFAPYLYLLEPNLWSHANKRKKHACTAVQCPLLLRVGGGGLNPDSTPEPYCCCGALANYS